MPISMSTYILAHFKPNVMIWKLRQEAKLHAPGIPPRLVPSSVERWRPSLVRIRLGLGGAPSEAVIYVAHNSPSLFRS